MAYVLPAASFQQEFQQLAPAVQQALHTCIVGPKRKVVKAGHSSADETDYGPYDPSTGAVLPYLGLPSGEKVDSGSVRVVLSDVHGLYGTISGADAIEAGASPSLISLGSGTSSTYTFREDPAAGTSRVPSLGTRDVRIGDRVRIAHEDGVMWSQVTGFVNAMSAPVYGDVDDADEFNDPQNPATRIADFGVEILDSNVSGRVVGDITEDTAGVRYSGDLSLPVLEDTYVIEVTVPGGYGAARVRITSATGDGAEDVEVPADDTSRMAVGTRGLGIIWKNLTSRNLAVGERFAIQVAAPYTRIAAEITAGTSYQGTTDTVYLIKVVKGGTWAQGPKVSVTTTTNVDSSGAQTVTAADGTISLGSLGLSIDLEDNSEPQGGLRLGDIYRVAVTAPKSQGPRSIRIKDPLPTDDGTGTPVNAQGTDLTVQFYSHQDEVSIPASDYPISGLDNWEAGPTALQLFPGIQVLDPTVLDGSGDPTPLDVGKASVRIYYTATLSLEANRLGVVSSLSSVPGILGPVLPENEASFGADRALRNSGGQPVYYILTAGDSVDDYREALKLAERNEDVYFMVPMSNDPAVINLVADHVIALSSERKGMERVAVVNAPVSEWTDIFTERTGTGGAWTGYVSAGPELSPVQYRTVTIPGADFVTRGVRPGDRVRTGFSILASGEETFESYVVSEVVDEETLLIQEGPDGPVGSLAAPHRIDIVRLMYAWEQAELASAQSEAFGDRRITNVFPEQAVSDEGDLVPGYYLAAAYAGLKSSVVPHQPITNVILSGFSAIPRVLENFSIDELNEIASGGTMIVAQDTTRGPIYVRHQITTDMTDANHSELSITTNLDAITKFLRSWIKPMIGRHNITPEFLIQLETLARQRLDFYSQSLLRVMAGPPIVELGTIVAIQDPNSRTGVLMEIPLTLPYPANNIVTRLLVV